MGKNRNEFLESNFDIPQPKNYLSWKVSYIGKKVTNIGKLCLVFTVWIIFILVYTVIWFGEPRNISTRVKMGKNDLPDMIICISDVTLNTDEGKCKAANKIKDLNLGEDMIKLGPTFTNKDDDPCVKVPCKGYKVCAADLTTTAVSGLPATYISADRSDQVESDDDNHGTGLVGTNHCLVTTTKFYGGKRNNKFAFTFKVNTGSVLTGAGQFYVVMESDPVWYEVSESGRSWLTVPAQAGGVLGIFSTIFLVIKILIDTFLLNFKWNGKLIFKGSVEDDIEDDQTEEEKEMDDDVKDVSDSD